LQALESEQRAMKLPRRKFLRLAVGAAALPAVSQIARAQAYPMRPVRIVVGPAAGGVVDSLARLLAQWLSERLGQPFVVENRPGAGGNIAAEGVVKSAPDGHTLLMVGPSSAINATLFSKLNFNFIRDIAPVAGFSREPQLLLVNPMLPAKSVPEFISYAKANPGKLNFASVGTGSGTHLAGELFKMMAGINLVHVPYRGSGPALTDLIAGRIQLMITSAASSIENVKAGKLRALAVTAATRLQTLPDIPTMNDFLNGYEASVWTGIGAPRSTPSNIIDKLNRAINAAHADPKIRARLSEHGGAVLPGSPADFGKLITDETEKWAKVIKFAGITPQ
jgi:tripartite-type tricarboxylate transporter receptor subunit TctC